MTTHQVTAIGLRVFVIWILIKIFYNLPIIYMGFVNTEFFTGIENITLMYVGIFSIYLFVGLLVAYLIYSSSTRILKLSETENESKLNINTEKFIFQILGTYFLIDAMYYIPQSTAFTFYSDKPEDFVNGWLSLFGLSVQLLISILLVSKPSFIAQQLKKIRERG